MNEIIINIIGVIVTAIIIPLITFAGTLLIKFLNNKVNSEKTKKYVEAITLLVTNSVKTTTQTYVNELKKNNSFDLDAQKRALELTKQMVLTQLNDETRKFLEATYKDLDSYLTCKIESTICELKNNK